MADADTRSTSQVVKDARANLQGLMQAEKDMAVSEVTGELKKMVRGIALLAGAGVIGLYVLGFAGVTGAVALQQVVAPWIAWLIVTGIVTLVLLVLALVGRSILNKADPAPTETKASIQETVAWAKAQVQR